MNPKLALLLFTSLLGVKGRTDYLGLDMSETCWTLDCFTAWEY